MEQPFSAEETERAAVSAKALLRKRARLTRGSLSEAAIAARSRAITTSVELELEAERDRRGSFPPIVALFFPILSRKEVDLRELDPWLRERGIEVAYPAIDPTTREMTFRTPKDPEEMEERGLGFREPSEACPTVNPDVIIVPALLVDGRGHRLGYGAGFYDRTLRRLCPPSDAWIVAFDFQLSVELPTLPTDVAGARVITDQRTFKVEASP